VTIHNAAPATRTLDARVTGLINERLDMIIDDVDLDLFATGLLDSLAFVTLLQAIEEEFGITIGVDDIDLDTFRSISSIVSFVSNSYGDLALVPTSRLTVVDMLSLEEA
jgi:D-alanine--poly(phosphoribitol) ligase subunit 2